MQPSLAGLVPAMVVPMTAAGDPDESALRRYVRWLAAQGPAAVAVNADTGEGPHLTASERRRILEIVKEETDLPCVAGLAGPSTREAIRQAGEYRSAGADALLVFPVPAFLGRPLDAETPVRYHAAIAEVGLPLVLFQLQPDLGGVLYDDDVLLRLADLDGVIGVKEASFDAERFRHTVALLHDRGMTVLTGNDNFILESFALGADGALVGFGALMTAEQVAMIEHWRAGRLDEARAIGERVQRLADAVFAPPVSRYRARLKECLTALGVLDAAHVRPPLLAIPDEERRRLRQVLVEVGLLVAA